MTFFVFRLYYLSEVWSDRIAMIQEGEVVKHTFRVKALWDAEAGVFYADSDIEGLHIEAATLDEFEAIMLEVAPELIMVNHRSLSDLAQHSLKDLIPAIVWQRPDAEGVVV